MNTSMCYEYIAVYVDDLCIAARDPKEIINILKSKYNLKVKGDGQLTYHLGADYYQDPDGTMVSQPKKYIEKLKETYVRLFNTEPSKRLKTPLEKNDHPELDTSDILEGQELNHYLTMVGQLQWLITLGRFDIQAQVITMDRSQNYVFFAFICITFHLHYICIAFAFRIAPGIDIFALHFISISKCQINVKC